MKSRIGISLAAAVLAMVGVNVAQATTILSSFPLQTSDKWTVGNADFTITTPQTAPMSQAFVLGAGATLSWVEVVLGARATGGTPVTQGWSIDSTPFGSGGFNVNYGMNDNAAVTFQSMGVPIPGQAPNSYLSDFSLGSLSLGAGTYYLTLYHGQTSPVYNDTDNHKQLWLIEQGDGLSTGLGGRLYYTAERPDYYAAVALGNGTSPLGVTGGGPDVPEPGTWLLLGGSLLGLCVGGFKRIRSKLRA